MTYQEMRMEIRQWERDRDRERAIARKRRVEIALVIAIGWMTSAMLLPLLPYPLPFVIAAIVALAAWVIA